MKRLLIVANRLPLRCENGSEGIIVHNSEGGLSTGLSSLNSRYKKEWIGWPGIHVNDDVGENAVLEKLDDSCHPVFLSEAEVNSYYEGFSNETLWPLFHYFIECTRYSNENWESYKAVNQKFCDRILGIVKEGDIIWIQDYHLMLLPGMLRQRLDKTNPIGFFLHIPFPAYELFRTLPWRKELLDGLLGSDLVGFHTQEYLQHFINTVKRITGYEHVKTGFQLSGRSVRLDAFPMGINFDKFNSEAASPLVTGQFETFRARFGHSKVVLSVDRLDYTKGIINRLNAFDILLDRHPALKEKISLVMLAVPSRDKVEKYRDLKIQVDEMVGYINGKYATIGWVPVTYMYRSIPFEQLVALYNLADICMVTPLRDGMNLVAKEYIASKIHGNGILILSEMAGAAHELTGAILVNPNDEDKVAEALLSAILMEPPEQQRRLKKMKQQVRTNTVKKWGEDFIRQLQTCFLQSNTKRSCISIRKKEMTDIYRNFSQSGNRLILLDYDGTLMPYFNHPDEARPDKELKQLLRRLNENATVVLISGRDHQTLENWFGNDEVEIVAEHGLWHKTNGLWEAGAMMENDWRTGISELLEKFVVLAPGAFVEKKSFSLAFHYRLVSRHLQETLLPEILACMRPLCADFDLDLLPGNKVFEIRLPGIDKGTAAAKKVSGQPWDFILAIGDDQTDEDMFRILPQEAYTIKVGNEKTLASMRLRNFRKVRELLKGLTNERYQTGTNGNLIVLYKKAV